jgi:cytoskeletal protein RodZ
VIRFWFLIFMHIELNVCLNMIEKEWADIEASEAKHLSDLDSDSSAPEDSSDDDEAAVEKSTAPAHTDATPTSDPQTNDTNKTTTTSTPTPTPTPTHAKANEDKTQDIRIDEEDEEVDNGLGLECVLLPEIAMVCDCVEKCLAWKARVKEVSSIFCFVSVVYCFA